MQAFVPHPAASPLRPHLRAFSPRRPTTVTAPWPARRTVRCLSNANPRTRANIPASHDAAPDLSEQAAPPPDGSPLADAVAEGSDAAAAEEQQGADALASRKVCETCGGQKSIPCSNCNAVGFISAEETDWVTCHVCFARGALVCPACQSPDAVLPDPYKVVEA